MQNMHNNNRYISLRKQLLSIVREMIGGKSGREDDEHPLPPGPWDPVIRAALERSTISGHHRIPGESLGLTLNIGSPLSQALSIGTLQFLTSSEAVRRSHSIHSHYRRA